MSSTTIRTTKTKIIAVITSVVVLLALAIQAFAAEAYVEVNIGDGKTTSSDYLSAKQVKLNGRIYDASKHGAYFTVLVEEQDGNNYVEDKTVFKNYTDTGAKEDGAAKYTVVYFNSTTFPSNRARKSQINPYLFFTDVQARAKLTKVS